MKHRAFTLLELAVVLAILGILAAILFPVFQRPRCGNSRTQSCFSNLCVLGVALKQYQADFDERFPLWVVENGRGWADQIHLYGAARERFHCPNTSNKRVRSTDYAFNIHLLGLGQKALSNPQNLIVLAEGENDAPTTVTLGAWPPEWKQNQKSPLYRHTRDRSLLALADGSVKTLRVKNLGVAPFRFAP